MPSPTWTRIVIGLFSFGLLAIVLVTGQSIDRNGYKWISGVTSIVVLIVLVYDRWAWRWPLIRWLAEWSGTPVLHGTWKGTLRYEADADGKAGATDLFMTIHQTYSHVEVHSYVETSESHSTTAAIERPSRGQRLLWFIYRSEAPAPARDSNRPHEGGCKLSLVGTPVHEIHGSYWTDRRRRGELRFEQYSRKCYGSFIEAQSGNYASRKRGS